MNMMKTKLSLALIAFSLTQAVSAGETPAETEQETHNTYWGVGIGSVLGAVIAGPPGAAIGGTLGGSIGWGKDQSDAREDSQEQAAEKEQVLTQQQQRLQNSLQKAEREVSSLKSRQSELLARMQALQEKQNDKTQELAFLEKLVGHYAQDIYFRVGQSAAPEDTAERLSNLVDLLKAYPDLQVTLKGYTDASGSAKLNAALAQARVDSIKHLLEVAGIEASRIVSLAVGEVPESISQVQTQASSNGLLEELDGTVEEAGVPVTASLIKRNPVLDRRVAIELSLPMLQEQQQAHQAVEQAVDHTLDQTLASLSGGEQ